MKMLSAAGTTAAFFHGFFLQQLLKYLPGEFFSNSPANEGGGGGSHQGYYLACKHHFQGSGALTCGSKMSIFPLKGDCCSLGQRYSSLLKSSGIYSPGSLKAIEQRAFLIHHHYTNTCAEQPCTELLNFFFQLFTNVQHSSSEIWCFNGWEQDTVKYRWNSRSKTFKEKYPDISVHIIDFDIILQHAL